MLKLIKKISFEHIILLIILVAALILRLYKIDSPLADWHSWRQADTSAVSRNFVKEGFDILRPRFDDFSSGPSGLENVEGYRFVEFPIYNLIQAILFKTLPVISLEIWGRLVSIIFSLGSLIFLYLLVKKYLGGKVALLSAFFFALLPFNIYYSRVVLPEPMIIFTSLGMIYFWDKWIERPKLPDRFLAILLAVLSFLLKPFTLVFLLPIAYLGWRKWQLDKSKWLSLSLYLFASLLPFIWWRWWMGYFPEGIPGYTWLFNETGIRFKGAFFWWIFAERIGRLILGYWGLVLLGLGVIVKPNKKEGLFFYSWLVAILAYFTIVAGGNVRHDYYQVLAIPIICIFLAKGAYFLLTAPKQYLNKFLCSLLFIVCTLFMLAFSWHETRGFFNINHPEIIEAGKAADRVLPQSAKVIAPYNGDTAFLYQINRQGWPIITNSVEYLINWGATHYVSVNFDSQTQDLMSKYRILEKGERFVVIDLTKKK